MKTFQTSKPARCLLGIAGAALIGMQGSVLAGED